jgi:hypothetical protein
LAVTGKTPEDISARAIYFQAAIDTQLASPALQDLQISYHCNIPTLLAEIYFALSEAYKSVYLSPENRTNTPKIAALTCASIAVVKPLRPNNPVIEDEEFIYVNGLLGLRAACAIVEHPFHTRSFDDIRRWCRSLDHFQMPSVQPIIAEAARNNGITNSTWAINLSSEERCKLDTLISMFSVLKDLKIYK